MVLLRQLIKQSGVDVIAETEIEKANVALRRKRFDESGWIAIPDGRLTVGHQHHVRRAIASASRSVVPLLSAPLMLVPPRASRSSINERAAFLLSGLREPLRFEHIDIRIELDDAETISRRQRIDNKFERTLSVFE